MLPPPPFVVNAQVATRVARYVWDEWNVNAYFMPIDQDQFDRLDQLSDAANLAIAIGCGEWICHRLSALSSDPDPFHYLEAAWAAIVHPAYCEYIELDDNQWRGPIRGPLNMTISILNDGIHCRSTDPYEATRSCWMYNLTTHVLPHTDDFDAWFEACVVRFEKTHPKIEDDDIWEEGPPFGLPVPREALDPAVPYDPADAPQLIDQFLRQLSLPQNPFLTAVAEVSEALTFAGTPYQYSP